MGGRGVTSGIKVMTEEEYLSSKGYAFMGYADAGLHISNRLLMSIEKCTILTKL